MNAADHPREQERMRTESGEPTAVTKDATAEATAPAEAITDFGALYPRQVRFNEYTVLSLAGDEPTAYLVNVDKPSCSCPDFHYNREDPTVCKHLAVALFHAPKRRTMDEFGIHEISSLIGDVRELAADAQREAAPAEAPASPEPPERDSEPAPASERNPAQTSDLALKEIVQDWLDSYVRHSEHVHVEDRDHGGTFGVALEIDYDSINDTQKDQIKTDLKEPDGVKHHTGFLDEGCKVCGEADDDYWIHLPEAVVRGLPE